MLCMVDEWRCQKKLSVWYLPCFQPSLSLFQSKLHPDSVGETDEGGDVSCQFCPEIFSDGRAFADHCNRSHPDDIKENWFSCEDCRFMLPDQRVTDLFKVHLSCLDENAGGYGAIKWLLACHVIQPYPNDLLSSWAWGGWLKCCYKRLTRRAWSCATM